jgi:hypothetical protein
VSSVAAAPARDLAGGSPLTRCTGDPEAFLATTWGRSAAIVRGVDALGFADLLTFDDVDAIVSTTSLRTPSFRLVRSDRTIPESAYTRSGTTGSRPVDGIADPARVFELFRDGATIVLQGLHRYWPAVTAFCRGLELEPGHACQVNAYITPPGAQGLALHEDPHDVFVLQTFGCKRWEIHPAPGEGERSPLETTLEPGDVVYMPTGTPHAASTQETLSGHLTIGVHVTTWRDVLADAWARVRDDPGLGEAVPAGWTVDPQGFARAFERRLRDAEARLREVDAGEVVAARRERFLSTRAPLLRGALVDQLALARIGDASVVHRRAGSVCEVEPAREARGAPDGRGDDRARDRIVVLLGDRRLEMPAWVAPAIRTIAGATSLRVGDLADVLPDAESRAVLVRRLVREGLLGLEPGR